ncbi:hypothetical protein GMD78_04975 [Ornithinibacillus sp. L9]|uniref:Uncharacterized protein n=1 Tax=Ornithinibacillus caprae TaxID=2678566 RepID=A0A6N8FHL9_9BACI|nr:hypothetical protein [Ornithinibacillus caprae]
MVSGFGNFSPAISITDGSTFSFPAGDAYSFIMPFDSIIESIYMSVTNLAFTPPAGQEIFPYVALATAPSGSNTFTLIPETQTFVDTPYVGGTSYPANTILSGSLPGIDVPISEGTRIAIVCGFETTGSPLADTYLFY